MATKAEIAQWFEQGKKNSENTHMIVVCDTFNYEDYPVYVKNGESVQKIEDQCNRESMQKVMEVYDLSKNNPNH